MKSALQSQGILLYAIGISLVAGVLFGSDKSVMAETLATIKEQNQSWLLGNEILRAQVEFKDGSIDLTLLVCSASGKNLLTGPGTRLLFRHVIDGVEMKATDGKWVLGTVVVCDIKSFGRHWGKSVSVDLARPADKITVTLVFEVYDGRSGLRYGSFIKNDDSRERVISSSDILSLNVPIGKHTLVYASLLCGCSTYYSDVRRWTPEQRTFFRRFNDWRKSPRISALLREVAHPIAIGEDNTGPYAWSYTHPAKNEALLVCVGFGMVPADFSPRMRTLDDSKIYLVNEVASFNDGDGTPVYHGAFTGAQLKTQGLPVKLGDGKSCASAFLLSKKNE